MTAGRPLGFAVVVALIGVAALAVLPAQQPAPAGAAVSSLSPLSAFDHLAIQQLVRKYAWAIDGGDDYGYALADLFTRDGEFVGVDPVGGAPPRYRGRDELATLARGGRRGATVQRHFTMNHVITPSPAGATGRAYVVVLDVGVVGAPNRVSHGGHFEDEYQRTPMGWRFRKRTYHQSKVDVWPATTPG